MVTYETITRVLILKKSHQGVLLCVCIFYYYYYKDILDVQGSLINEIISDPKKGVWGKKKGKKYTQAKQRMNDDNEFSQIKKLDFPPQWDQIIVNLWLKDTRKVTHTGHIKYIQTKKWSWINRPNTEIFAMIRFILEDMVAYPALMINHILSDYIEENTEKLILSEKEENRIRRIISRALRKLVRNQIVYSLHIPAEEKGRLSACIYYSPFALQEEIEKCKRDYLNIGGGKGKAKKTKEDYEESADRELDYREIVKKKNTVRKVEKMTKMGFTFYECPNCEAITKIPKEDEQLYTIKENKLLDPCTCGFKFRKKIVA